MLVTLKPISSQDLLALEIQMFPDCLCVNRYQESVSQQVQATCWSPSLHAAPHVTAERTAQQSPR